MNNFLLLEDQEYSHFLPLILTRHIADLRFGATTMREKWEEQLNSSVSMHFGKDREYLSKKFPSVYTDTNFLINSRIWPNAELVRSIRNLEEGEYLVGGETLIACHLNEEKSRVFDLDKEEFPGDNRRDFSNSDQLFQLTHLTDIFTKNQQAVEEDFRVMSVGRNSYPLPKNVQLTGDSKNLFIEEGAKLSFCALNTSSGPIYIGKNVEIMEGAMLRGPLAICNNSVIKMGAKIYGPTTIGPWCKIGGEVNNCVFQSFTNKAHDGFLGNSVIGEWCNIGADTNCSNLKNNYSEVKIWNSEKEEYFNTGLTFCGLLMGDHSKCGINTMFNTGTVVGVNANIFGSDFPPKHVPSFSWGGGNTWERYDFEKAVEVAKTVCARRKVEFSEADERILKHISENTRYNM